MLHRIFRSSWRWGLGVLLALGFAFFQTQTRIRTIQLGYEIGKLKEEEAKLIERRGQLLVHLAKITTKENLEALSHPSSDEQHLLSSR